MAPRSQHRRRRAGRRLRRDGHRCAARRAADPQKIERNSQIDAAFDTITYGKGGHVVSMIAAFMGDTKFRDGVRGYMAKHKYGNASTADFFGAMADAAGDPRILPAMQSFTDQQGVPLVTFAPAGEGKWTVTQSRYVRLGTKAPAQTWGVPLCLRQGDARLCQLLVDQSATIAVPGSGVLMPNAGGTGYYRFELPAAQWDSLIAQGSTLPGGEARPRSTAWKPASWRAAPPAQMVAAARSFAANPDSYASDGATGQLVSDDRGLLTPAAHDGCAAWSAKCAGRNWPSWASIRAPAPMPPTIRTSSSAACTGGGNGRHGRRRRAQRAWLAADGLLAGDAGALDPAFYNSAFKLAQAAWPGRRRVLMEKALSSEDPVLRPRCCAPAAATIRPRQSG
jgi:hypothetical protein